MNIQVFFAIFAILGLIDLIFGGKLKLGKEFEKGIMVTGSLIMAMMGMLIISPVLADFFLVALSPVTEFLNIDVSVISGLFACDAGGAVMAFKMTQNEGWAGYNGIIVGSMLGAMISLIPVSLNMTDKEYHNDVLTGLLCGIATIPVGCIVGGIIIGCPLIELFYNSLFTIIISLITCLGLVFNPDLSRKIFKIIGKGLCILLYVGLGIGILEKLAGIKIFENTMPMNEAFSVVGDIALILAGVLPLVALVSRLFKKGFSAIGKTMGINEISVVGLLTTAANCIPVFAFADKMNQKGRIMNYAFMVSAAFIIGDHMAFTLAFQNSQQLDVKYLIGMLSGKFVGGITSLIVAHFVYKTRVKEEAKL